MKKQRIVTITDCTDVAMNEIRAAIISELDKLGEINNIEIEPFVRASEFSLINGVFLVRLLAEIYSPQTTTFLVVLNPLRTNRSDRARIIGETRNGFKFVGENTGTLSWLIKDFGLSQIYESSRAGLDGASFLSFGGKYIHAPIAARVAAGMPLNQIGPTFDIEKVTCLQIEPGTVLHIDNFGVMKILGNIDNLAEGTIVDICVNGICKCQAVYARSMKNLPDGTWVIYKGSSLDNLPEVARVRKLDSHKELNVQIGDMITWNISSLKIIQKPT